MHETGDSAAPMDTAGRSTKAATATDWVMRCLARQQGQAVAELGHPLMRSIPIGLLRPWFRRMRTRKTGT